MTFYVDDKATTLPDLPSLGFILDDSPSCHQSLDFWEQRTEDTTKPHFGVKKKYNIKIGNVVSHVASCTKAYHKAGLDFSTAGANLTCGLQKAANVLSMDANLRKPLLKFTDILQRIECYHGMFLTQTEMLMSGPLELLAKEFEKVKEMKQQVKKANQEMHMSWEKFSSCQNSSNLQEPSFLDRLAHNMFNSRQHYQQLMSSYINSLRDINTVKKISFVKILVEHILAKFFFVNFTYQILKDSENYINELFDDLLNRGVHSEISCENDARVKKVVELKINRLFEKEKAEFHDPPTLLRSATLAHSVTTVNTQAGKFLNRINDFLSTSALRESTRRNTTGSEPSSPQEDKQPSLERWDIVGGNEKVPAAEKTENTTTIVAAKDKTSDGNAENSSLLDDQSKTDAKTDVPSEKDNEKSVNDEDTSWSEFKSAEENHESHGDATKMTVDEAKSEANLTPEIPNISKWFKFHRGYLRIKQKAFPKNKWPLLYFIVDESSGRLLAQGKDQKEPSEFANLLLSNVKICNILEVDRNFCFQLTSPKSEHVLQALTENEMQQWIAAIQTTTTEALKKSKEKLQSLTTTFFYGSNSKSEEKKQYVSNASERVRNVEGNKRCVDCNHPRPDWASINLGIVMCIECSGVHRSLGVHISKVRSLTLDKWEEKVVQFMESSGNIQANKIYEANLGEYKKPERDCRKEERGQFIRLKYTERKFMKEDDDNDNVDPELELASLKQNESDEEKLLEESEVPISTRILTLDHDSARSSPLCLVENCQECLSSGHTTSESQDFSSSQLKVDDGDRT